jgi:hypothetical protein|tara:strand:- start:279 stop:1925 length:1647 start_codon:yes stop_codon:yes gene_type:complete
MAIFKIDLFKGTAPKLAARLLADGAAKTAVNCRLDSGDLAPIRGLSNITSTVESAGTENSLYKYDTVGGVDQWFRWDEDVDVVRSPIAANTFNRVYFTGDSVDEKRPRSTYNVVAVGGGTVYPSVSFRLGIPAPTSAPTMTVVGSAPAETDNEVKEARSYVYTFVSLNGEEGPPSPPSAVLDLYPTSQTVNLTTMETGLPVSSDINVKNIYRTVTSTAGTFYMYVDSVVLNDQDYSDSKTALQLQGALPSTDWVAPPAGMIGLTSLSNGILAGFKDNEVMFCEPFMPHAWPTKYRMSTDYSIVAIKAVGSSLIVTTKAYPYVVQGTHPSNMTLSRMRENQSCVSKRSIVNMGSHVMYASPDGLVSASGTSAVLSTDMVFSRTQWQALKPETIHGYMYEGNYIGLYTVSGVQKGFIFNPKTSLLSDLTGVTALTGGYSDPEDDALYFIDSSSQIKQFDSGSEITYEWHSKQYKLGRPINMAVAQVEAESYSNITISVYAESGLVHSQAVLNERAFRLPSGYRSNQFEVKLVGTDIINSVSVATSMSDII